MNLEMGLVQQQTMKLVMTQQLRQAISLLQYSTTELSEYIEEQALENPLLEVSHSTAEMAVPESPVLWQDREEQSGEQGNDPFIDRLGDIRTGLTVHLTAQLRMLEYEQKTKEQLEYFIHNLDENGYLLLSEQEAVGELDITSERYHELCNLLQQFDPIGVGARSLAECLLVQMQAMPEKYPLAETIVSHYLQPFAEKKWKWLAEELQVTLEEIQAAQDFIQTLNPRPAQGFGQSKSEYIAPDVYIEKDDGEWKVILNDDSLPRIRLNRQYRNLLQQNNDKEAFDYAHSKYKQLVWLLKSIDQRQQTIRAVTEAIVEYQKDFLENGELRPMTLRHIAERADVHESTVSRTTNQKYVQTPRGCYELKAFFSKGLAGDGGEEISAAVLKQSIRRWIEQENKQKPMSDQKIADRFQDEEGVKISRRAVAKYRDEQSIPSSSKRKRFV
ncbi:RNA polymerase factor sigma-54 [Natribacillus halophilus]|uniref:RNA polymerase, sigma 54 subunit, RpoN/SigL n=1 Tax=Natribacillus halophilus TaxID=549003 RepID=A0A1G8KKX7_9BACI|nr:RNA polymerase factor sigma-54 [Natribacillus halophilus]SDI44064.1 RNA polymerase, sigma 54 subunit, RpoN/SigL [Natribacillus halophilus]